MPTAQTPYGLWDSPITPQLIVNEVVGLDQAFMDEDSSIYWLELRPQEGGRSVIVKREPNGTIHDLLPSPFSARSRVHEYGGGSYSVFQETIAFCNDKDQRVYILNAAGYPEPITPLCTDGEWRYADLRFDPCRQRLLAVREHHHGSEVENVLVSLSLQASNNYNGGMLLAQGTDFISSPALSPNGKQLAWLTWNHPNMPWNGTTLWVAEFDPQGNLAQPKAIAGFERASIFQPMWSPENELFFISDANGWWNIYRWLGGEEAEIIFEDKTEFGRPQWVFNLSTYGFLSSRRIVCSYCSFGSWRIGILDLISRRLTPLRTPYTDIKDLRVNQAHQALLIIAGSPTQATSLIRFNLKALENKEYTQPVFLQDFNEQIDQQPASHRVEIIRTSSQVEIEEGYVSVPQEIDFPTSGNKRAYAFFYPPRNRDFSPLPNIKPPLIVISHGGPTSMTSTSLNLSLQFWTSRGFAVVDVNYGGSSGFGREYRERLRGKWGIVDVEDCINAARYLVDQGKVAPQHLIIRGGSAGGFTTLCAITFHQTFKAAASYYGISDLEGLVCDTHKFESRYLDQLIAPYPQQKALYKERSPLFHAERISCPIIFFQGKEDRVVPPNQAEQMVDALRKQGVYVEYILFENEGHGFRSALAIQKALEAELAFYLKVFNIKPQQGAQS